MAETQGSDGAGGGRHADDSSFTSTIKIGHVTEDEVSDEKGPLQLMENADGYLEPIDLGGNNLKAGPGLSRAEQEKLVKEMTIANLEGFSQIQPTQSTGRPTQRRVFVMRHGERLDRVFPGWIRLAFGYGKYKPFDLNQPISMIKRSNGAREYANDSPLTEIGYVCSQMVGRGLRLSGLIPTVIYSSPSYRCVQTAHGLLKALEGKTDQLICIEPGLFEWLGWYDDGSPNFIQPEQLKSEGGYRVDTNYQPIITVDQLNVVKEESYIDHVRRYDDVMKAILAKNVDPCCILIVGHATTVDACGRALLGRKPEEISRRQLKKIGNYYPYCAMINLEEMEGNTWKIGFNTLPPISYMDFTSRIDRKFFNRP